MPNRMERMLLWIGIFAAIAGFCDAVLSWVSVRGAQWAGAGSGDGAAPPAQPLAPPHV
jgi:hypothetical protein